MVGLTSVPSSINYFKDVYSDHHIDLAEIVGASIPYKKNINTAIATEVNTFRTQVENLFNTSRDADIDKYCVNMVYVDQLDKIGNFVSKKDVTTTAGMRTVDVDIRKNASSPMKQLWIDRDSTDWFINCIYVDDATGASHIISKTKIVLLHPSTHPNYCKTVRVDISSLSLPVGSTGDIFLNSNVVSGGANGISFSNANIVCMRTRTNGNKRDETELNKTMAHEVGHQIGMAPTGQCPVGMKRNPIYTYSIGYDIGLDKGVNYYDQYKTPTTTHTGPHCKYTDTAGKRCLMYGAGVANRDAYCPDCSGKVMRMDLTKGVPNKK